MAGATPELVLAAVQALNHDPDPAAKAAANEWLTAFQQAEQAWGVADALLHTEGVPMEATFLAVQTLCRKMQRDFRELPAEQHIALRDSIIAHVRKGDAILIPDGWWHQVIVTTGRHKKKQNKMTFPLLYLQ